MAEPSMMSLTSPLPPQSHRIDIRWSAGAIKNFALVDKAMQQLQKGWMRVWKMMPDEAGFGPPDKIVSDNIKRNLDQGITPEMKTWAPLSPGYAMRVGRGRMMFSPWSEVYDSYVYQPDVQYTNNTMTYAPNMAFHHAYYSWLRGGYTTHGTVVPGREWFGLSADFKEKMNRSMARVTYYVMNQAYAAGAI